MRLPGHQDFEGRQIPPRGGRYRRFTVKLDGRKAYCQARGPFEALGRAAEAFGITAKRMT